MGTGVVHELRRAATALEEQAATRARLAAGARQGWSGPHRAVFDDRHERLVARVAALADACRRAATSAAAAEGEVLTRRGRFS